MRSNQSMKNHGCATFGPQHSIHSLRSQSIFSQNFADLRHKRLLASITFCIASMMRPHTLTLLGHAFARPFRALKRHVHQRMHPYNVSANLPTELIDEILGYLSPTELYHATLVNRRFNQIVLSRLYSSFISKEPISRNSGNIGILSRQSQNWQALREV
jgi:hypothetical protein